MAQRKSAVMIGSQLVRSGSISGRGWAHTPISTCIRGVDGHQTWSPSSRRSFISLTTGVLTRSPRKRLQEDTLHSAASSRTDKHNWTTKRYLRLAPTPETDTKIHRGPSSTTSGSEPSAMSPPYNSLTYYTFGTPNGLKPAIVLEELGLQYEAVKVDISKNAQKEPWFIDINPNGRIPALKDGDLRIFESGAIMLYLVDHYDTEKTLTYDVSKGGKDAELYYEMLSWLMFQMAGVGPMQGQANHFRAMAPVYSAYGIKRYVEETQRLISVLEIRLSKADWLAGDKYTIADIANFSWVRGASLLDVDVGKEFPGVARWIKRIDERDAVKKARTVPEGGVMTDEQLVGMFENMKKRVDGLKGTEKDEL